MEFEIRREVNAPIADVWAAWTTAESLEQWYSPGPMNWTVEKLDVRPGGNYRMTMDTPKGPHVSEGTYHEVKAPHRLSQGPVDKSVVMHTTLEESGNHTRMKLQMDGLPEEQHDMMRDAWNRGFDKLQALLD